MAKWSREKVNSENINGGNQYEKKDRVTLEQLNAMVNSGLYSQDFAEHLADAPDISQANTVGSAKVEVVDNVVGGKTYKKFKFSNLKGEKGEKGDKGDKGDKGNTGATPVITATATTLSAGSSATATISGSAESPTINFGIPKGDKGETGEQGVGIGYMRNIMSDEDNGYTINHIEVQKTDDSLIRYQVRAKNGETGPQGPQGPQGEVGPQGPQGPRGEPGLIYQSTGQNTDGAMSQKAATDALDAHISDFLVEKPKVQDVTGAFYGENLLINPHLTCNQRGASTNQTTTGFMFDRWYKCCTNEAKVYLRTDGQFELRFLKTLTSPVRLIEQRIDIPPVIFHKKDIVISLHIMNCTSNGENSTCFGAEYFNSAGESLGVIIYPVNSTGIKVLQAYIPNGTTSITFFYQANANVTKSGLIRFRNPKIEFGKVASKFGGRINDSEITLCNKYYYTTGVSEENAITLKAISATEFEPSILSLPTPMARVPDITLFGSGGVQNTLSCVEGGDSITVSAVSLLDGHQYFKITATNAVAGNHYKLCGYTADAETTPLNVNITDNPDPISPW